VRVVVTMRWAVTLVLAAAALLATVGLAAGSDGLSLGRYGPARSDQAGLGKRLAG
jgi:hypothetical protein